MLNEQNKFIAVNIHSLQQKKKQTTKHDRTRFAWKLYQLKLTTCVNYFLSEYYVLFFTNKSVMQLPLLHDLSVVERLETTMQCILHGAYFEDWVLKLQLITWGS